MRRLGDTQAGDEGRNRRRLGEVLCRARPELAQFDPAAVEAVAAAMIRTYDRVMHAQGVDPALARRITGEVMRAV